MTDTHTAPTTTRWLIYGANGYTGELIAREAVRRGHAPTLAGRNRASVERLATELGLEARVFALDDAAAVTEQIAGHTLVLHCAGPFSVTAEPMMQACIAAGAHYLDITGEIAVFEQAQQLSAQAKQAGVALCPGVGFDVIPTDCVAAALKDALPDATDLALGFDSGSGLSPGTAKTSVEGMAEGGKIRRDGQIVTVPLAYAVRKIDFGAGQKSAMSIPWGDVSTAFHTTGIPNIQVFFPAPRAIIFATKLANLFRPLLGLAWVQNKLKALIDKKVAGPDEAARAGLPTHVWGEAKNAQGQVRTARITTQNVYSLTVTGALAVTDHLLTSQTAGGTYTPARLCGTDLVASLPGSGAIEIQ